MLQGPEKNEAVEGRGLVQSRLLKLRSTLAPQGQFMLVYCAPCIQQEILRDRSN